MNKAYVYNQIILDRLQCKNLDVNHIMNIFKT